MSHPETERAHANPRSTKRFAKAAIATLVGSAMLAVPVFAPSSVPAQQAAIAQTAETGLLPNGAPFSFADLVERVSPGVVSIRVEAGDPRVNFRDDRNRDRRNRNNDRNNDRNSERGLKPLPQAQRSDRSNDSFNDFFRRFFEQDDNRQRQFRDRRRPNDRRPYANSQGSGFVVSNDGYVVTNNHVIENATRIEVSFEDGSSYDARLIGTDSRTDLALLKIDSDDEFPFVEFAEKDVRIGDWVVAVGNPFGLGGTVTAGIVSALGRDIGSGPYDDYLQIDASINRGNSGGPAFNLNGRVIGVNTAIYSPSGGSVGIGFAIPSSVVQEVVAELREDGVVTRGWLGVGIQNITDDIAESLGLEEAGGALVSSVAAGSPAEDAGIREGDAILRVNGESIEDSKGLARRIASLDPDDEVILDIVRDGDEREISVTLGALETPEDDNNRLPQRDNDSDGDRELSRLGMEMRETDEGVVVSSIDQNGPAYRKGIRSGDVIIEVGGVEIQSLRDVLDGIRSAEDQARKSVLIRVRSGEQQRFVAVPMDRG